MIVTFLILIIGISALWIGGECLVKGAQSIGYRLHLSPIFIGLTIVSFGTSAPELIVNVIASYHHQSDIVFGNIIGSNIANILLILGCCGIVFPLTLQINLQKEVIYHFLLIGTLTVLILVSPPQMIFNTVKAAVILVLFSIFLITLFCKNKITDQQVQFVNQSIKSAIFMLILGIILLPIGGKLIINGTTAIALSLRIPEAIVSLIAIGIGTSLPELAASIIAATRHETDIVIGNILGSNIFNIGLILSISGFISPLVFPMILIKNLYFLLIISLLFLVIIIIKQYRQHTQKISRLESGILLVTYVLFLISVI